MSPRKTSFRGPWWCIAQTLQGSCCPNSAPRTQPMGELPRVTPVPSANGDFPFPLSPRHLLTGMHCEDELSLPRGRASSDSFGALRTVILPSAESPLLQPFPIPLFGAPLGAAQPYRTQRLSQQGRVQFPSQRRPRLISSQCRWRSVRVPRPHSRETSLREATRELRAGCCQHWVQGARPARLRERVPWNPRFLC